MPSFQVNSQGFHWMIGLLRIEMLWIEMLIMFLPLPEASFDLGWKHEHEIIALKSKLLLHVHAIVRTSRHHHHHMSSFWSSMMHMF